MNTIADLLSGLPSADAPRLMVARDDAQRIIRWQRVDPKGGFVMVLRYPLEPSHMCGYVLVNASLWDKHGSDELVSRLGITYDGPGTKLISWRVPNGAGRLVVPVKLAPEGEADHWLGIDFQNRPTAGMQDVVTGTATLYRALQGIGVTR